MMFADRNDAGRKLATKLEQFNNQPGAVVIGLPRGGVVVACEVARRLNLPLDIIVPRKIGAPGNEELAIGAITEEGEAVLDEILVRELNVAPEYIAKTVAKEKQEAQRRLKLYRGDRAPLNLQNKTAILIDDGIATGATMRAAIKSAKYKKAAKIIVAVPVIAPDTLNKLRAEADEIIYLDAPMFLGAIGAFYEEFSQTEDKEVIGLMREKF
jgi:putative phosphoribosyl transferase